MKYIHDELSQYASRFEQELHNNILAYWIRYAVEKEGDGFYGAVDLLGNPVPRAPKSCVLNARILWTFAAAAKESGNPQYGIIADRAFNVLNRYFADAQYGGYFMSISAGNHPLDDIKHTYAQAFVLYALSKYYEFRPSVERMRTLSVKMLDSVDRVGIDKDGGLFLESTRFGSHLRTNKHWWPQAETLVALMNGFQLTGDPKYWEKLKLSWNFIDHHVIDHEHGEWFTKVSRLGVPYLSEPEDDPSPYYRNDWKIDPWKCPYHNGRAMMELISRIRKVTDAIKN